MTYSLFECQDGSFLVTPLGLAPPLAAYRAHGHSIRVSDACRHPYDTVIWEDISRAIDRQLYAEVPPEVAVYIFDIAASARQAPDPPAVWLTQAFASQEEPGGNPVSTP